MPDSDTTVLPNRQIVIRVYTHGDQGEHTPIGVLTTDVYRVPLGTRVVRDHGICCSARLERKEAFVLVVPLDGKEYVVRPYADGYDGKITLPSFHPHAFVIGKAPSQSPIQLDKFDG